MEKMIDISDENIRLHTLCKEKENVDAKKKTRRIESDE